MEGIFKEVIIKEISENAAPDKVFIVENLPKKFLVQEVPEMKRVKVAKGQVDDVPTGNMIEVPLPYLQRNEKDGSFLFFVERNEAKDRLADIDRYIQGIYPRDQRIPQRVYNSSDLSSTRAYPLEKENMPRVVLPLLTLPTQASPSTASPVAPEQSVSNSKNTNTLSDEEMKEYQELKAKKEAARERMAAARAAK